MAKKSNKKINKKAFLTIYTEDSERNIYKIEITSEGIIITPFSEILEKKALKGGK
jgi:hypothetical protein